ncbi:MAG: YigZ family protein [Spirochaetia bacterium]|nr:YigZ family protein [Spirochaetia bacterium]
MQILLESSQCEIEVKKSRFIAIAHPLDDLGNIKDLVAQTRALHPQANHVVHAAVIGPKGDLFSVSDDHEPKNTAGRPALEVLKGSGITNIVVLIVRYFGGTLLGTGGLVKAYADSVKNLLPTLKTEELIDKTSFSITIPYNLYDSIKKSLLAFQATINTENFLTDITIEGNLPTVKAMTLSQEIIEISNGSCSVHFSDS